MYRIQMDGLTYEQRAAMNFWMRNNKRKYDAVFFDGPPPIPDEEPSNDEDDGEMVDDDYANDPFEEKWMPKLKTSDDIHKRSSFCDRMNMLSVNEQRYLIRCMDQDKFIDEGEPDNEWLFKVKFGYDDARHYAKVRAFKL